MKYSTGLRRFGICGVGVVIFFSISATLARGEGDKAGTAPTPPHGAPRMLQKEVLVSASPEEVWNAWTTPEGISSFFAPKARVELKVDGVYELYFAPDAPEGQRGSEGCKILSFLPNEMLSFTWNAPPSIPNLRNAGVKTQVILRISSAGADRTSVQLTQWGFGEGDDWGQYRQYFDRAWGNVLNGLVGKFQKPAGTDAKVATPAETASTLWIYWIRPARDEVFTKPSESEQAIITEHLQYMSRLFETGKGVFGGPPSQPSYAPEGARSARLEFFAPGFVVFEAENLEDAKTVMNTDPAVRSGVFKAQLNPFRLAFNRYHPAASAVGGL